MLEGQIMMKDHPKYAQYFKMMRLGIALPSIHMKMKNDGVDPSILEYVFFSIFASFIYTVWSFSYFCYSNPEAFVSAAPPAKEENSDYDEDDDDDDFSSDDD